MIQENQQDFTPSFLRIYKFWKNSKSWFFLWTSNLSSVVIVNKF
jgi:hypothetical protein